jgi:hypothetical protein
MYLPYVIISTNLFSKNHLYKNNQHFCVDCKFYIPNDLFFGLLGGKEFGKCKLYYDIKNKEDSDFLVTGKKKEIKIEYNYCSICRNDEKMCGKQGIQFLNKNN